MKTKRKTLISTITILCLLAATLTGCGSTASIEVTQVPPTSTQEVHDVQEMPDAQEKTDQEQPPMEAPDMEIPELSEEEINTLLQAGLDAVTEESELWSISEITDQEVLQELMQPAGGAEAQPGGKPENMPSHEGEEGQIPEGSMPAQREDENPPENGPESQPEGEMPEKPDDKGGDHQRGNRGGGMAALAIVISGTEDTTLAADDILAEIQLAAEELGYQANSMELSEEQQSVIEVPDGQTVKLLVLIHAQMPEMEAGEAVG